MGSLGPHRKLLFEYTLLGGVNDHLHYAKEFANLLRGLPCKINLIPFNSFDYSGYQNPSRQRVLDFQSVLIEQGYTAMIRSTRGDDISAACGQLAGKVRDRTKRSRRYRDSRSLSESTLIQNLRLLG